MSSLGGRRVSTLSAHVPKGGAWWANVLLEPGAPAPAIGPTTLVIGDLSLVGGVERTLEEAPSQHRVIARGAAGLWRGLPAPGASWQSDSGVKLRTILKALAAATGESVTMPDDATVAEAYGWAAAAIDAPSTGAMVLDDLVVRGALPTWRVEPGGAVCVDAWPALPAADRAGRLIAREVAVGLRKYGLDNRAAAFLPGATTEGVSIGRVTFRERAAELRAEVWEA